MNIKFLIVSFPLLIVLISCQSQRTSTGLQVDPPAEGKAILTGQILNSENGTERPYMSVRLLAGVPVFDPQGEKIGAEVGMVESPKANTDEEGRFVFKNLEPGTYFLVIHMPPLEMIKLNDPSTGKDMFFELEAGEIKDIGKLVYGDLPYWLP